MSVKVAVILPSRGLIFSQTADELLQNVRGIPHKFFFAHRKPLPDCFEEPTNRALKDKDVTHLWFVEDDMILPSDTLKKMLDRDLACVTVNYPTTARQDAAVLEIKGRVVYGGTGCTLVKREVFNELKKPYFRTDIKWIPRNCGDYIKFTAKKVKPLPDDYGFHDVNFFMNLWRKDIPVHQMDFTVGQRKLKELGKSGSNDGAHKIDEWFDVKIDDYFELTKEYAEAPPEDFVEVVTPTGRLMAKADHAEKLIKAGLGEKAPRRAVVIDDLDIL